MPEETEKLHCERCGFALDHDKVHGPLGDFDALCQACEKALLGERFACTNQTKQN